MFIEIKMDNLYGISVPIELNFISQSRNKDKLSSVIEIEKGIYVNKLIGIISGNAGGKTSFVKGLDLLKEILIYPILQFDINDKIYSIKKLLENNSSLENHKLVREALDNINSSVDIGVQNLKRKNFDTTIEVLMYISQKKTKLDGYYRYKVVFNGLQKKIKSEIFTYKKQYKEKEKIIIDMKDAKEGQLYYINRYYKNIEDIEIEKEKKIELEEKYKYCKVFVEHYIESSAILDTNVENNHKELKYIDWLKKSPTFFKTLTRVVDSKIRDVVIDSDNRYEELMFVLEDGSKIKRSMLSQGTEKFLSVSRYVTDIIEKNGFLVIDEIEQNLHKDLVEFIIKLFSEITRNNSQIIFTTLSPDIFDIVDIDNKKIFKQDSIFVIDSCRYDIKVQKLIELKIDGERVKSDASVTNLFRNKKISCHPDKNQIDKFIYDFKENLFDF